VPYEWERSHLLLGIDFGQSSPPIYRIEKMPLK
jgi:hypothetical protein